MSSSFQEVTADNLTLRNAATDDRHAVRLLEFNDAIGERPTQSGVEALLEAELHDPVTIDAGNQSLDLTLTNQELSGEVRLIDASEVQASDTGLTATDSHPVVYGDTIDLGSEHVSSVVAIRRPSGGGATIATGVSGVDYYLDARRGILHILAGSNLITSASQEVYITFDCAQINDGPGAEITPDGLKLSFGLNRGEASRGDHIHDNDHPALSGETTDSATSTVGPDQKLRVDVVVKSGGGITVGEDGLEIDTDIIPALTHTHNNATTDEAGFMSASDKIKVDQLEVISVASTTTLSLFKSGGQVTGTVRHGAGLTTDSNGLRVDYSQVAAADHEHDDATDSVSGFMSAADKSKLDGLSDFNVSDTDTVDLVKSGTELSANVRIGVGLTSSEDGVEVDFDQVAAEGHTHPIAGSGVDGFASTEQIDMLYDHEVRIQALEAGPVIDAVALVTDQDPAGSVVSPDDVILVVQDPGGTPAAVEMTLRRAMEVITSLYQGTWSAGTFNRGDMVTHEGSLYLCRNNSVTSDPTETSDWYLIVEKGDTGATGSTGSTGAAGENAQMTRASTSSVAIATGSKAFSYTASATNIGWAVGQRLRAVSAADAANFMEGAVTAVSSSAVTISVDLIGGSGTYADWNIVVAGVRGSTGATGSTGAAGADADMTRTSTTSLSIGTGSKTANYSSSSNLGWLVGTRLRFVSASNTANYMEGPVTSVSSTSVTISSDNTGGSGTHTDWNIGIAGDKGATGSTGSTGSTGPAGDAAQVTRTSTTSLTIGTGTKTFSYASASNLGWVVGTRLRASDDSDPSKYMEGVATAVSATSVDINVDVTGGAGTLADWNIGIAGDRGPTGAAGSGAGSPGLRRNHAVPASLMYPSVASGATAGSSETTTNKVKVEHYSFADGAKQYASFLWVPPEEWDRGTIKVRFIWKVPSGYGSPSGVVRWEIEARAFSDDDPIEAAWGTSVNVTDTLTAVGDVLRTAATGALTVGGSPALGDIVVFRINRDALHGSDTLNAAAQLIAVHIQYTEDTTEPTAW